MLASSSAPASCRCSSSSSASASAAKTTQLQRRAGAVAPLAAARHSSMPSRPRPHRPSHASRGGRRPIAPLRAISIDRRAHMELAWKRQAEEEAALAALAALAASNNKSKNIGGDGKNFNNVNNLDLDDNDDDGPLSFEAKRRLLSCPPGSVTRLRSVAHLDALAAAAAPAILAVAFYSRSCGTCKETLAAWGDAAAEAGASGAGVIFLKHDVRDEFDEATDLARMHRVRAVPSLLFFAGGAAVSRVTLADARVVAPLSGGRDGANRRARLRAALQAVLFRETPSARR